MDIDLLRSTVWRSFEDGHLEAPVRGRAAQTRRPTARGAWRVGRLCDGGTLAGLSRRFPSRSWWARGTVPARFGESCARCSRWNTVPSRCSLSTMPRAVTPLASAWRSSPRPTLAIRYLVEVHAGLSRARNAGLADALYDWVAFTDDDVLVDPWWLRGVERGIRRGAEVGCVTGLVPPASLVEPAQRYFDERISWTSSLAPARLRPR